MLRVVREGSMRHLVHCGEVVEHCLQLILLDSTSSDHHLVDVEKHEATKLLHFILTGA